MEKMTQENKDNILTEFINKMFEDIQDTPPEILEDVDKHFFEML